MEGCHLESSAASWQGKSWLTCPYLVTGVAGCPVLLLVLYHLQVPVSWTAPSPAQSSPRKPLPSWR